MAVNSNTDYGDYYMAIHIFSDQLKPWHDYMIINKQFYTFGQVSDWLYKNYQDKIVSDSKTYSIYFKREEDYILFKLTWM